MSEDAQSKKGLMCQDTLGCIKLLSALPCCCDTVCISNITRREETVCASVRVCAGVCHRTPSCSIVHVAVYLCVDERGCCPRITSFQAVCHLELNTHTALAKKDMGMHSHLWRVSSSQEFISMRWVCISGVSFY